MATTIKADLINDSGLVYDKGNLAVRRVYAVYGLDPTKTNQYAVALGTPGLPYYGQPHPDFPSALAQTYDIKPLPPRNGIQSATALQVTVTYSSLQFGGGGTPYTIEFGSALSQVITDTDRDGNEIFVTWSARKEVSHSLNPALTPQRAQVPKNVRHDTIRYSLWLINVSNTLQYPTPIELLREKYHGKVNSQPFRGGRVHDWMCTLCDGSTQDFGKSYIISMELERRPVPPMKNGPVQGGWDEWAWYTVEDGGIARGVSKKDQDGVKLITNIYDEVDFSQIGNDLTTLRNTNSQGL